jgi:hypothetical protein
MDFFRYLDPMRYFTRQEYVSFWGRLFETVLSGIWARLISVCFLALSFYFMARRQNVSIWPRQRYALWRESRTGHQEGSKRQPTTRVALAVHVDTFSVLTS